MIDVLKRLAELDAGNPNVDTGLKVVASEQNIVVKEDAMAECGIMPEMGMGGMSQPHTPASINMTAASGEELSGMLKDIMSLAGLAHSGDMDHEPMGDMPPPAEPEMGPETPADSMRSVIDKLNPGDGEEDDQEGDKEETDEGTGGPWNNSPDKATDLNPYDKEGVGPNHHENQPGSGETSNGEKRQSNMPTATYESLMAEYQKFIAEGKECKTCHKPMKKCECDDE